MCGTVSPIAVIMDYVRVCFVHGGVSGSSDPLDGSGVEGGVSGGGGVGGGGGEGGVGGGGETCRNKTEGRVPSGVSDSSES